MSTNEPDDVELARKAFGAALRLHMGRFPGGITKRALGEAAGISEGTIGNYWRDKQTPRIGEILAISRALHMAPEDLFDSVMEEYARIQGETGSE